MGKITNQGVIENLTSNAEVLIDGESRLSVQFSRSVMSNSLQPHESQHARPPCPSPAPGIQTHVPRVGNAIQPSHPLSSPSPPAPNPSQHQSLFQGVNSSHEVTYSRFIHITTNDVVPFLVMAK